MTPNALIQEASPYLQQHAYNPVRWLPWGNDAFHKARQENKPIFLSVGYAACHWCHVMAHESFESEEIASVLNQHFVPVKVDREERPDVDHFYMQAVTGLTGHGGWPLSVFLTPELKPFYGGTYWPPEARWGRPGFRDVLRSVAEAWTGRRTEMEAAADEIHQAVTDFTAAQQAPGAIEEGLLDAAVTAAEQHFDGVYGGFGPAPKFPHAMELHVLLRIAARKQHEKAQHMVLHSLDRMARGGIYDQIGGGFHRYSTDARWLIPHFEKMLYDNALLAPIYFDAYRLTGDAELLKTGLDILEWALREMQTEGGFTSSLDADSEGEEGKFYLWKPDDVKAVLGEERGTRFCRVFDISETGNFEGGRSIPNRPHTLTALAVQFDLPVDRLAAELEADRQEMRQARDARPRPARDEKILTDWCGLFLTALVKGFAAAGDTRYLQTAQDLADRLLKPFEERQRLVHSQLGEHRQEAQLLLDYAALAGGLLDLFLCDGNPRWYNGCTALVKKLDTLFANPDGPYFMSAEDVAGTRAVDPFDSALPAGTSLAGNVLARLHHLTGDSWYLERAQAQLRPIAGLIQRAPAAFSQALVTVELLLDPPPQLVLVGDAGRTLWQAAQTVFVPGLQTIWLAEDGEELPAELAGLLRGATKKDGLPTAYLCRNFACELPVTTAEELQSMLRQLTAEKS